MVSSAQDGPPVSQRLLISRCSSFQQARTALSFLEGAGRPSGMLAQSWQALSQTKAPLSQPQDTRGQQGPSPASARGRGGRGIGRHGGAQGCGG